MVKSLSKNISGHLLVTVFGIYTAYFNQMTYSCKEKCSGKNTNRKKDLAAGNYTVGVTVNEKAFYHQKLMIAK